MVGTNFSSCLFFPLLFPKYYTSSAALTNSIYFIKCSILASLSVWKWVQASLGLFTQLGGNPLKLLVLSSSFQYELQRSIFCVCVLNLAIVCITLLKALIDISKKLKLPVASVEIGTNKADIFTMEQHAVLKINNYNSLQYQGWISQHKFGWKKPDSSLYMLYMCLIPHLIYGHSR